MRAGVLTGFDLDRARAETPGCASVVHFNNAGAGLMPRPVIDAIRHHLDLEITTGGYEAAAANAPAVERAYGALAQLLNGRPDEIAAAALYLATAEWVTGEVLDINGGAHLMRYPDLNKHVLAAFG